MPCHLILTKLAEKCGSAVLAALNEVVEPLERTISCKVKADAVKQEKDRNEDIVRSALRSLDSLSRIRWVGGVAGVCGHLCLLRHLVIWAFGHLGIWTFGCVSLPGIAVEPGLVFCHAAMWSPTLDTEAWLRR